jgi:DNA-directed RNA polymerase specialized sigma24 family protein
MKANVTEELSDDLAVEDHADVIQTARSLELLLERLRPAQAEVIRLVKLQGLSIAEAAERTGHTASLVKVNIHRGLSRLSAIVQDESDEI